MVTQDLIDNISRRFKQGQTREEIKQALIDEGWEDVDVDEAIRHIQKTALSQLPLVSAYTNFMAKWDEKSAHLSMPAVLAICGVFAIIVLIIAFVLYNMLDPFNSQAGERDVQRQAALVELQKGIKAYASDKRRYPKSLDELSAYMKEIPRDPKTNGNYDYSLMDNQRDFELCVIFETQPVQCISSSTDSAIPTVLPTEEATVLNPLAPTVTGLVFLDVDGNGKRDAVDVETPFADMTVVIKDAGSKTACEARTDTTGTFLCNLKTDGTYQVTLEAPSGYRVTPSAAQTITLPNKDNPEIKSAFVSFGLAPVASTAIQPTKR